MNQRKRIAIFALIVVFAVAGFVLIGNRFQQPPEAKHALSVAATVFPVYDLTRQVAGDVVDVELILSPGASPHTFDPTPSTLTSLQGVKRIFALGQGIDTWSFGIADNIVGAQIVSLDKDVQLKEYASAHGDHSGDDHDDGHGHGDFDPHYWLDPDNAILMSRSIAEQLSLLDPSNAQLFDQNAETFAATIRARNVSWQQTLDTLLSRNLITFHDAFFYFADHFDLTIATTFEPFPGKEPTPSYLRDLEHDIEEHDVRVLFTEPQLYGASLQQFAKDHNLFVAVLDPLGGVDGRMSYVDLIEYNVETIAESLK